MKNLSDVTGVIHNDHALYGEQYLHDHDYSDTWQVVVANDKMLMLDYDDRVYDGTLPEQFHSTLGIFDQAVGSNNYFQATKSKGGNTHVLIHIEKPMPIVERIAWQAAFGSDPKREALHLLSVSRGELNPILLFMRKDQKHSGVDEQDNPRVRCSRYEVSTPEKIAQLLLEAGIPQIYIGEDGALRQPD